MVLEVGSVMEPVVGALVGQAFIKLPLDSRS